MKKDRPTKKKKDRLTKRKKEKNTKRKKKKINSFFLNQLINYTII